MEMIYIFYFFLIGLFLGSFTNVLIYRIPEKRSIVIPGSFCPKCKRSIKFYDNIPIISFIILLGKCRYCKGRIPLSYPIIEMICGILSVLFFLSFGITFELFIYLMLLPVLISIAIIDLKTMYIYDSQIIFIFIIAVLNIIFRIISGSEIFNHIISGISIFVVFLLIHLISKIIYKKEVFGFGDVLLGGALGLFFEFYLIPHFILMSSLTAGITGLILYLFKKERYVPYGPFLILSFLFITFFNTVFMKFYEIM